MVFTDQSDDVLRSLGRADQIVITQAGGPLDGFSGVPAHKNRRTGLLHRTRKESVAIELEILAR